MGTHGRSIFILDDVRPLRKLSTEVLAEPLHLFQPPPAQQYWPRPGHGDYGYGINTYRGENRPYGALITFAANFPDLPHPAPETRQEPEAVAHQEDPPEVEIVVLGGESEILRTLRQPLVRGINRAVWDLQREPFEQPPWKSPVWINLEDGIEVPPGDYEVVIRFREHQARAPFQVLADPESDNTPEDWQARWNTLLRIGALNDAIVGAAHKIRRTFRDLEVVEEKLQEAARDAGETQAIRLEELDDLVVQGRRLAEELRQLENRLWLADDRRGIPAETDAFTVMWYAFYYSAYSWEPPTPSALAYVERAEGVAREVLGEIDTFFETEIGPYREAIRAEGVELLP